jgi:hypothetical protein
MSQTLKGMLDSVLLESGMDTETVYVASSDTSVQRLVNLANRSARRIAVYPWQALRKTYVFSLTDATEYDLPDDYRAFIPDTGYVTSTVNTIDMRTSPEDWGYLQSIGGSTGPTYQFRILGDKINVYGPTSGDQVRIEYLTDYPVLSATGTAKKLFTVDTDTWILDDDLLIMNIIFRYKKLLGLQDWQIDAAEYADYERVMRGQEAASKTIEPGGSVSAFSEPYTNLWVNN